MAADYNPTIIAASLNDTQLKASINSLVSYVTEQTNNMANAFDSAVGKMEQRIKSLNLTSTSNGDNGSSRRTRQLKEEVVAYDQIAEGQRKVTQQRTIDEKEITAEIRKQAEFIRSTAEFQKTGKYSWEWQQGGGFVTSTVQEELKWGKEKLSLEEQLVLIKRNNVELEKSLGHIVGQENNAETQALATKQQKTNLAQQQLQVEQQVTQELQKQKASNAFDLQSYRKWQYEKAGGQVLRYNEQASSIDRLNSALKQQQHIYSSLTAEERSHPYGQTTLLKIQGLQRAIQKLNSDMARPASWAAIEKMPTKTLDDISYKLQMMQRYLSGMDVSNIKEINNVNTAIADLTKKQRDLLGSNQSLLESNNALARSWNYMKNRLAFYFTVGASTMFIRNLIEVRSQYEMNERALGILIDSAERGTEIFKELSQMALVSPYTLIELSSAAKQLTAYGVAARDVVDTTRRLADMAAAVGMPMERLTYALGQIKAYGYLNSRDQRMFANAGIPLVKQLSDYYTQLEGKLVSTADVYDRIKKRAVDYNDVMQVMYKMTDEGGRFFDFQAKMAGTLKVQLANLTLAWNNMLNDIGASQQGTITFFISGLKKIFLAWKDLNHAIGSAAWATGIIVAFRALNVLLVKSGVEWRILSKEMTTTGIAGTKVASILGGIKTSLVNLMKSPMTWWSLLAFAIVDITRALINMNEAQKEVNRSIREGAKENYKNVTDFLERYQSLRTSLSDGGISKSDANRAWEEMREQIELSSKASDKYIGSLLQIEDVSNRLKKGFEILNNIQEVSAALKEIDDDTIKMDTDWSKWWNLWMLPDDMITNLKEYSASLKEYREYHQLMLNNAREESLWKEQKEDLERFREDLKITTDSLINFITLKGWTHNPDKINEVFSQFFGKLAIDEGLNPQEAFNLQLEVEEARAKAAKVALYNRIEDYKKALLIEKDEENWMALEKEYELLAQEYNAWELYNGKSRVYWQDFTKWMKEQHISEMTAMFRNMDAKQIASLDFEKGEYYDWVDELVKKYATEHKMAYSDVFDTLKHYITNANKWSIFIPLTIGTEKKSIYEELTKADSELQEAEKKIERLKTRKTELQEKGGLSSSDVKVVEDYTRVEEELAAAEKDKAKAEAEGGHNRKQEEKDRKARREAQSELQQALKEEISLIDKVRSTYQKLTKEGVNSTEALETATSGFDNTLNHINSVLSKYGIGTINLADYAGKSNPRAIMEALQAQLDALKGSGLAKPAEIKDLEVKLQDLRVDSLTFDQQTLIRSLNSELGKLKEEYDLAVELDANPELGENFATLFGINPDALPHTIQEYGDRMLAGLNKYLEEGKQNLQLPSLWLTRDDISILSDLVQQNKLGQQYFDAIKKSYEGFYKLIGDSTTNVEKYISDYIKDYGDMSAQLVEIENEKNRMLKQLDAIYYTDELKQTQDYLDKRQMIIEAAAKKIAKTSFDALKRTDDYERFFTAIDTLTKEDALKIKSKIKADIIEAFRKGAISVWQFRKELKALESQFDKLTNNTSIFSAYLKNGFDGAISRAKDLGQEIEVIGENIAKTGKIDTKDQNFLNSLGNIFTGSNGQSTNFGGLMQMFGGNMKGLGGQVAAAGQGMQAGASGFASAVAIVDTIIKNIHGAVEGLNQIFNELNEGRNEDSKVGGMGWDAFMKFDQYAASGWEKLKSGNVLGAAMDTVNSIIAPIASIFSARNKKITRKIEESERQVKKLANSYEELKFIADNSYGVIVSGAERATIENKKLQLAEAERQLQLEKSRKSKYQDKEKIIELQGQVESLRREIKEGTTDIVNDLLGISSAGDKITNLVQVMIEAFRNGEDAMEAFGEEWDKMLDNMVLKMLVSEYMKKKWDEIMKNIELKESEFLENPSKSMASASQELERMQTMTDKELRKYIAGKEGIKQKIVDVWNSGTIEKYRQKYINAYSQQIIDAEQDIKNASKQYTEWTYDYLVHDAFDQMKEAATNLYEALGDYYTFGESGEGKNLSNLQQGIQGITEDTAGALEAYMNSVSQQVYLHSDLLTQIRDTLIGWDMDVNLGVQAQMLFQLQQSYQVQMSIQNILEGTLNPTSRAFMVELAS